MSSVSSLDEGSKPKPQLPNSSGEDASESHGRATVYDAVAGRLTNDRFIRKESFIPSTRDTIVSSRVALPPGEALFRSSRAPGRHGEMGIYDQDRNMSMDASLPSSDLLKSIHSYSADFYAKTAVHDADLTYRSLDGSALIALGVLLEESCDTLLGETGHLALLEEKAMGKVQDTHALDLTPHGVETLDEQGPPAKKRKG